MFDPLAILRRNRLQGAAMEEKVAYDNAAPSGGQIARIVPQTLTEIIDEQIRIHESRIKDLKEAKAAISPEVEKALNALAKL